MRHLSLFGSPSIGVGQSVTGSLYIRGRAYRCSTRWCNQWCLFYLYGFDARLSGSDEIIEVGQSLYKGHQRRVASVI